MGTDGSPGCRTRVHRRERTNLLNHPEPKIIRAGVLDVAFLDYGRPEGWPLMLSHGFPYDVHAYDEVAPLLAAAGARVIVPWLRGFGPTRFASSAYSRSCQQAALGSDLMALAAALHLDRPILAGYDWGGLASCVATALWPERVGGLVSLAGYDVLDIASGQQGQPAGLECVQWYQHLFQTERGRDCLQWHRNELCALLWRQWSPRWSFDQATFDRTAVSFDNPDFVPVVVSAYRHMFGLEQGRADLEPLEQRLARKPPIMVPSVSLDGTDDPLKPGGTAHHATHFIGRHEHRNVRTGHNLPQEAPDAFADAVPILRTWLQESQPLSVPSSRP